MSDLISQDALKSLAAERGVSQAELDALCLALTGKSIDEIAQTFGITSIAVRKRLGEVYRKFDIQGKGPGKLEALKRVLEIKSQRISEPDNVRQDWGDAPDISVFYGREKELQELQKWIVDDCCRLVALVGLRGIGKTALTVKLVETVQEEFDFLIWRSLSNYQNIAEFLDDVIQFLSENQKPKRTERVNEKISLLIRLLREHRCLLVIDEMEMVMRSGTRLGRYKREFWEYGDFLREVAEQKHNSCVFVCSQEKPKEVLVKESPTANVRLYNLKGLEPKDAKKIFIHKGLNSSEKYGELIEDYKGNPLRLRGLATTIKNLFNGHVQEFNRNITLILRETDIVNFTKLYEQLSDIEKEIAHCLATQKEAISFQKIAHKIIDNLSNRNLAVGTSEVGKALESLESILLLEIDKYEENDDVPTNNYTLEPFFKKFISKKLKAKH